MKRAKYDPRKVLGGLCVPERADQCANLMHLALNADLATPRLSRFQGRLTKNHLGRHHRSMETAPCASPRKCAPSSVALIGRRTTVR